MTDDNHLQDPGFFAMKLNSSRFETLEHGDVQYGRGVDDLCVPRSLMTHL